MCPNGWRCHSPTRAPVSCTARIPHRSFARPEATDVEREKNVFVYKLAHLSHRLNRQYFFSRLQAKFLANQIERKARQLKLNRPIFFYPHGESYRTLSREMKQRGFDLVHMCMDYHIQIQLEHVQVSDITLSIIEAAYFELRDMFGAKIHWLRQFGPVTVSGAAQVKPCCRFQSSCYKYRPLDSST